MTAKPETKHPYWYLTQSEQVECLAKALQNHHFKMLPLDDEDRNAVKQVLLDAIYKSKLKTRRAHPRYPFIGKTR